MLSISDYYNAAARGRPPSTSGASSYDMQGKINIFLKRKQSLCFVFFSPSWW
jgi:hypothetical protein